LESFKTLEVRPGDSLSAIARAQYGQSSYTILDLIKLANPEVKDVDRIQPGQALRLPELREGLPIVRDASRGYGLLVFTTPNAQRAQVLAQGLRSRGFDAQVHSVELGQQKKVFRVTVHGGNARADAVQTGLALRRVLREDPAIVRMGQ
jgi:LysM repeat protein